MIKIWTFGTTWEYETALFKVEQKTLAGWRGDRLWRRAESFGLWGVWRLHAAWPVAGPRTWRMGTCSARVSLFKARGVEAAVGCPHCGLSLLGLQSPFPASPHTLGRAVLQCLLRAPTSCGPSGGHPGSISGIRPHDRTRTGRTLQAELVNRGQGMGNLWTLAHQIHFIVKVKVVQTKRTRNSIMKDVGQKGKARRDRMETALGTSECRHEAGHLLEWRL